MGVGGIHANKLVSTNLQACQKFSKKISKINHHVRVDHQGPRSLDLFLTARQFFRASIEILGY